MTATRHKRPSTRFASMAHNTSGVPNLRVRSRPVRPGSATLTPRLEGFVRAGLGKRLRGFSIGLTQHTLPEAVRLAIAKLEALTRTPYPLTWRQVLSRLRQVAP